MKKLNKLFNSFFGKKKKKTLVIAYGRLNPPSYGHLLLVEKMHRVADAFGYDHLLLVSHSHGKKADPLKLADKMAHIKRMFEGTKVAHTTKEDPSLIHQLCKLQDKYENIILVVGEDRVLEFDDLLQHYNGKATREGQKLYKFETIQVVSCGFRDPDSDSVKGVSSTKMRRAAMDNDLNLFLTQLPPSYPLEEAKRMFKQVQDGLR